MPVPSKLRGTLLVSLIGAAIAACGGESAHSGSGGATSSATGGGGATSSSGGSGGATTTMGGGGSGGTTTSTGGTGGTTTSMGGGGTGGVTGCFPEGSAQSCYSGDPATAGVGVCKAGEQTCLADGSWGPCNGEVLPGVEDCSQAGDEDCSFGKGCSETLWGGVFGEGGAADITATAFDAQGNLHVVGCFSGTLDFGGQPMVSNAVSAFLVKLGPQGVPLWSRSYGMTGSPCAADVAVDPEGNAIVTGELDGSMDVGGIVLTSAGGQDVFVAKVAPDGMTVWARRFGDGALLQRSRSVATNAAGEIFVGGYFEGTLDFDGETAVAGAGQDAFLAKLSKDGDGIWAKAYGGPLGQYIHEVAVDAAGYILFAGSFQSSLSLGALDLTAPAWAAFLVKVDDKGDVSWGDALPSAAQLQVQGLAVDAQGDATIGVEASASLDAGGETIPIFGDWDIVLAKFGSGGALQWHQLASSVADDWSPELAVDSQGRLTLAFYTSGDVDLGDGPLPSAGASDVVVAQFEPDGTYRWARRFGLSGVQASPSVSVGSDGEIAVSMSVEGEIDVGGGVQVVMGGGVAIVTLAP